MKWRPRDLASPGVHDCVRVCVCLCVLASIDVHTVCVYNMLRMSILHEVWTFYMIFSSAWFDRGK